MESEHGGWTMSSWSDDIGKFKFEELFAAGALLLGRVTYQGFAAAWRGGYLVHPGPQPHLRSTVCTDWFPEKGRPHHRANR